MKESSRKVGLHTIITREPENLAEAEAPLKRTPIARRLIEWAEAVDCRAKEVLANEQSGSAVREFAARCQLPAYHVINFLRMAEHQGALAVHDVALAMEASADLEDEWKSLIIEESLGPPMQGAIRTSEGGRKGALRRHAREKSAVEERRKKMESFVRSLKAAGNTRKDIVTKTSQKFAVKASTLIKNPVIRAHLPASRRISRG